MQGKHCCIQNGPLSNFQCWEYELHLRVPDTSGKGLVVQGIKRCCIQSGPIVQFSIKMNTTSECIRKGFTTIC